MNDDQRLLASAALDGDVTAEERARAMADPEVVAEIERLRAVRAGLSAVEPPDADRRESAIAAALAAFDGPGLLAPPPSVVAPRPPSAAAHRRHRWLAPLAAAAAVAVIAVGGIVATRDGGGDEDSSSVEQATTQSATDADSTDGALSAIPAPAEGETADEAGGDAGSEATESTDAVASPEDQASEQAPTAVAAPLSSPEELAAFAGSSGRAATAIAATCAGGTFVGATTYLLGGEAVPVEVFVVDTSRQALARRIDDCRVVAHAPLP